MTTTATPPLQVHKETYVVCTTVSSKSPSVHFLAFSFRRVSPFIPVFSTVSVLCSFKVIHVCNSCVCVCVCMCVCGNAGRRAGVYAWNSHIRHWVQSCTLPEYGSLVVHCLLLLMHLHIFSVILKFPTYVTGLWACLMDC